MPLNYDKLAYERRYTRVYSEGACFWEDLVPTYALVEFVEREIFPKEVWALDLGCGEGRDSIFLAKHGFNVIGIDVAPSAIHKARVRARRENVEIEFIVGDVTYLDFLLDGKFSLAVDIGCLHTIVDEECRYRYLRGVYRVLKVGGLFFSYNLGSEEKIKLEDLVGRHRSKSTVTHRIRTVDGKEKDIVLPIIPAWPKTGDQYVEEFERIGFRVILREKRVDKIFGGCWMIIARKE